MTDRQAYVAFNLTENVGSVSVGERAAVAGSVAAAWAKWPRQVSRTGGPVDWEAEFEAADKFGVTILTPADAEYPKRLLETKGHPLALYVKGEVSALSRPGLALVGTRHASAYGREQANRLAYDLASAGWAVVSGLALGIDAASHRGALDAGGVTIGVLGSGLDCFYPEQNRGLGREIVQKGGAVISEFPFGRAPDRETFPIRNHVVAALTSGTIAIECPLKSGTMITCSVAADLGRTVMAVPARVDDPYSAGCLKLLREGALLVRGIDDVQEAMSELLPRSVGKRREDAPLAPSIDPETPPYSVEEALFMLHVDEDGVAIDELVRRTELPVSKVNALAMALRMKGFVRFLPGNRVALPRRRTF